MSNAWRWFWDMHSMQFHGWFIIAVVVLAVYTLVGVINGWRK